MTQIGLVVEAWGEGFNVGALVILMLIVVCNLRRRVLLHKLILLEVCIASGAQFVRLGRQLTEFSSIAISGPLARHIHLLRGACLWLVSLPPSVIIASERSGAHHCRRDRYLSSTVVPLYISYFMHNLIAWMKLRPFLSRRSSIIYLGSLCIVQPYWAVALWTNFVNFNALGENHYKQVRPWEALLRQVSLRSRYRDEHGMLRVLRATGIRGGSSRLAI